MIELLLNIKPTSWLLLIKHFDEDENINLIVEFYKFLCSKA